MRGEGDRDAMVFCFEVEGGEKGVVSLLSPQVDEYALRPRLAGPGRKLFHILLADKPCGAVLSLPRRGRRHRLARSRALTLPRITSPEKLPKPQKRVLAHFNTFGATLRHQGRSDHNQTPRT